MRQEEFYRIVPKEEVRKIVGETELPAFVYFRKIIKRKYEALSGCLPRGFSVHYAFKANPNREVIDFIRSLGVGADVASLGELRLATVVGFPTEKIEFTGPGKTFEELSFAMEMGVSSVNAESISEIAKILNLCRAKKRTMNVGIRLNPKSTSTSSGMKMAGDTQFGVTEDDLDQALALIQKEPEFIKFTGFHMHLGSQFLKLEELISNFRFILDKTGEIISRYKLKINKINFGGGWGIDIFGIKPPLDLERLRESLSELFVDSKYQMFLENTRLIVEPGRFLVSECGLYAARILYRKKGYKKEFLVIDGGLHQNYLAAGGIGQVIRRNLPTDVFSDNAKSGQVTQYTVTGSLCIPDDVLATGLELDSEIKEGDTLVFLNCGAYAFSASPLFFLTHGLPKEVLI